MKLQEMGINFVVHFTIDVLGNIRCIINKSPLSIPGSISNDFYISGGLEEDLLDITKI